ncbi:MAG: DEAD/DEAH box helicase domain protein [Candidatus Woesebacteria bacterium GW2011_GWA1_41_13b]|uniref:DEAD/DEAH box helicase domain protein n=1 Tax=Candidatus Woesebacteria bacterium GW2011_GWA1_41_13b TaxID=1618555 RepID=A0A0G0XSM2_9BACT|nr:MAG: DEAD/DEAH box helicase domain protein [Candidatus Woesebacteria bacterium GW2011_GWA1_41_13b]
MTRSFRGPRGSSRSRPPFRPSRPVRRGNRFGDYIDPTRFINKAVVTETVEEFVPEHQFADFGVDARLQAIIAGRKYITPTPIQDRAIPHILEGKDLVGIANTGTGKTAAFLVPLIDKLLRNPEEQVLVVVPTRELADQIDQELKAFTRGLRFYSACCVGGASINRQISQLRYKNQFVIGTPGRLKDLINRRYIRLAEFKTIVLDEADRMLDMGFINDIRTIMAGMPSERHTLFFSATLSTEIERLISEFLRTPIRISVKTRETAQNVDQDVVRVERGQDKLEVLHELLNKAEFSKVLIFGRTKHGVERLSQTLAGRGFKAESIHGNKKQSHRQRALAMFKASHIQVLVATDVAARGLDIADVSHVINYDLPATYEDYVHRIGRTGRANKRGKALTFVE